MAEMGIGSRNLVSDIEKGFLIQQLGIDAYQRASPCDPTQSPYTPSLNGWNNGIFFKSKILHERKCDFMKQVHVL